VEERGCEVAEVAELTVAAAVVVVVTGTVFGIGIEQIGGCGVVGIVGMGAEDVAEAARAVVEQMVGIG
jgi:hypothetical protein